MDWTCTDSDRRLSDYLERLTTPEETAGFSAHLATCADCAALVERVSGTVRLLRATEAPGVPPYLFNKIVNATSGASQGARGWRRWIRPAAIAWQPQFAMGAITIAASFLIVFHAAGSSRSSQNFATLNPLNLLRAANRQMHITYAHTAKFVSDMRLVYEIQSRLEPDQDQQETERPSAAPAQTPGSNPKPESQPKSEVMPHQNNVAAIRRHSLYASFDAGRPTLLSAGHDFSRAVISSRTDTDLAAEAFPFSVTEGPSETPDDFQSVTRSHS
jgi:Putative zinc-finger